MALLASSNRRLLLLALLAVLARPHPRLAAEARQERAAARARAEGKEEVSNADPNCPRKRVKLEQALVVLKNNTCTHMAVGGLWPKHAVKLFEALADNSAMMMLDLNQFNEIGDDGAEALGKALRKNRGLRAIFVANNAISEDGGAEIAAALDPLDGGNDVLQSLDLGANELGVGGAKALAKALRRNKSLTALYLGSNGIGNKGAAAFAATLKSNSVLKTLFMRRNRITNAAIKLLTKAMEKNTALTRFDVEPYTLSITGQGGELKKKPTPDDNKIDATVLGAMKTKVKANEAAESKRFREKVEKKAAKEEKQKQAQAAIAGGAADDSSSKKKYAGKDEDEKEELRL